MTPSKLERGQLLRPAVDFTNIDKHRNANQPSQKYEEQAHLAVLTTVEPHQSELACACYM